MTLLVISLVKAHFFCKQQFFSICCPENNSSRLGIRQGLLICLVSTTVLKAQSKTVQFLCYTSVEDVVLDLFFLSMHWYFQSLGKDDLLHRYLPHQQYLALTSPFLDFQRQNLHAMLQVLTFRFPVFPS